MRRILPAALLGLAALLAAGATARAEEMRFHAVRLGDPRDCGADCPEVIAATGEITLATPGRFLDFVEAHGHGDLHAVVFLDSLGGRVVASMEFGTLLRKIGAAAVVARVRPDGHGGAAAVDAQCFSACVYALMGATKRVIPPESRVGIHRMFVTGEALRPAGAALVHRRFDAGGMRAFLKEYSSEMGIDPGLISAAETVPSEKIRILTAAEIRRWHLGVPTL